MQADEIWCFFWVFRVWRLSTLQSRGQNKGIIQVPQSEQNKLEQIHLK